MSTPTVSFKCRLETTQKPTNTKKCFILSYMEHNCASQLATVSPTIDCDISSPHLYSNGGAVLAQKCTLKYILTIIVHWVICVYCNTT